MLLGPQNRFYNEQALQSHHQSQFGLMHICYGHRGAQESCKNNKDLPKQTIFQVDVVRHRNMLKPKYGKHATLSIFSQLGYPSLEPAFGLL